MLHVLGVAALSIPFSVLSGQQRAEFEGLATQDKFLVHDLFGPFEFLATWKDDPWFTANGWESAYTFDRERKIVYSSIKEETY